MRTAGFLLAVSLSISALFAPAASAQDTGGCGSGKDFVAAKAFYLKAGFDPDGVGNPIDARLHPYRPPQRDGAVGSPYRDDLIAAFDHAPAFLQRRLCRLDAVFIDRSRSGTDLAIWENIDQRDVTRRTRSYIIVTNTWWRGGAEPKLVPLSIHEAEVNAAFLPGAVKLVYASRQDDDKSLTLLSILGHEMGHIVQYKEPYLRDYCPAVKAAPDGDFFAGSWAKVELPARFHQAQQTLSNIGGDRVLNGPSYLSILRSSFGVSGGRRTARDASVVVPTVSQALSEIYGNGTWFSLFATVAPDEDFAETFKLLVLRNASAPLTSLLVRAGSRPEQIELLKPDVFAGRTSLLAQKEQCLGDKVLREPTSGEY